MHRALQIPEVLKSICQELDPKSALAASTTCKVFLEPSLDSLWSSIDSFEPIWSLLPADVWRKEANPNDWGDGEIATVLHLTRPLAAVDLQRYLTYYASRIREIHISPHSRMAIPSPQALQALQLATGSSNGSLTPLLKTFGWYDFFELGALFGERFMADLLSCTSLFAGENTRSFIFTTSPGPPPQTAIFPPSGSMPNLKKLVLQTQDNRLIHSLLISSPWTHLETLAVNSVGANDIPHLSSLPQLAKLYIGSLPDLLRRATAFLQYIDKHNAIQSFVCEASLNAATSESQDLVNAIATHLNPAQLTHLQITDGEPHPDDLEWMMPMEFIVRRQDDAEFVQQTDIAPLYAFNKLQHLTFCVKGRAQVTPEVAMRIAESWRQLRYLDVCGTHPIEQTPSIDHRHLSIILKGCPHLKHLGVPFDATRIGESESLPHGPFSKLSVLHVCDAPISSPSRVESFIRINFPQLEELDVQHAWAWMDSKDQTRWDALAKAFGTEQRWAR
ncbi:hypothetical protein NMY22_g133 [Coprinellus aureogranulatus]|nr:hypothetical protein NMY22_g133 [Coprinellus aureogranulatus]